MRRPQSLESALRSAKGGRVERPRPRYDRSGAGESVGLTQQWLGPRLPALKASGTVDSVSVQGGLLADRELQRATHPRMMLAAVDSGHEARSARERTFDDLYGELHELLAHADALESESETARRIAEVDAKLAELEEAEVQEMRAIWAREERLAPNAGAAMIREIENVLTTIGDPGADDRSTHDG